MPEMVMITIVYVGNENKIPEEIIKLYKNPKKVEEIGLNARKTYENILNKSCD